MDLLIWLKCLSCSKWLSCLKWILIFKIRVTLVFWSIPLMFFPGKLITFLGFPEPTMFVRLLGASYLSLIIVYYAGVKSLESLGKLPESELFSLVSKTSLLSLPKFSIIVAIVNNALAAIYIFMYRSDWIQWNSIAPYSMIFFGILVAGIAGFLLLISLWLLYKVNKS